MNAQPTTSNGNDLTQMPAVLADRMDTAIGEASSVMGSVMTELIRRSLRGGVLHIGEELHGYVCERVDVTIVEKTPVLENIAFEVADKTARTAATEIAKEETEALARETRENDSRLAAQIEQTAVCAREATAEVARDLTVKIEVTKQEAEKHAVDVTEEAARGLSSKIEEAEKRACETARGELDHRLVELKESSREVVAMLKDRIKAVKETAGELTERLIREQAERKTAHAALEETTRKESAALREAADRQRQELLQAVEEASTRQRQELMRVLDEASTRLRKEADELRAANAALAARVAELEKPGWFRRLLNKLMFWRKR